jgi:hypothetical protein
MSKEKTKLDEAGRVAAVLNAAGRATAIAEKLPAKFAVKLAGLCNQHGECVADVRDKVITILRECGQEMKATIKGAPETETPGDGK